MSVKVSVVIPAYNAEKIIKYAINSALGQTLKEIEILVIDDGSKDDTAAFVEKEFAGEERVKLLRQRENMGVGEARNRGICEAKGDYVAFLDSDDAYLPDMLEKLSREAEETGSDVVHAAGFLIPKIQRVPEDLTALKPEELREVVPGTNMPEKESEFAPPDFRTRLDQWYGLRYHWSIWNKLYRRKMLTDNNIFFDRLSMAEDMLFCFKCLYYAEKYRLMPLKPYIYRIGGAASLTRSGDSEAFINKLLDNEIKLAAALEGFLASLDFFRENPVDRERVMRVALNSIDQYYLSVAIQKLGTESIIKSGGVHDILKREFGDKSGFVEYLFLRYHESATNLIDAAAMTQNIEAFEEEAKTVKEKALK